MADRSRSPVSARAHAARAQPGRGIGRRFARQRRRLGQAALVGLAVAGLVLSVQWAGLFSSAQNSAADYLYDADGDPGDDIVIAAIDEKTLQALGDWPLPVVAYAQAFERLAGAAVVGLDVLLPEAGPVGHADTAALLEAASRLRGLVVPLATLELIPPGGPGELYKAGQTVRTFPALLDAATAAGSVNQVLDRDGTVRRVPLLIDRGAGEVWQAFGLQVVRLRLGLENHPVALLGKDSVSIGDETEVAYEVRTDASGTMLVNYVGRPNTFPSYSLIDVLEGRVPASVFEDKVVLVGVMNALTEMDLHRTPGSAQRMAGVELLANVIHTLLHHRPLVRQGQAGATVTVVVLALVSAVVMSQLGAAPGALFSLLLALGYFGYSSLQFSRGYVLRVLFPYVTIFVTYAAASAARFATERGERRKVTDVFGRFVSAEVADAIVDMALADPDLIRPGGQQMEISVLFADIRGFTTIAENLQPPDAVEILNLYLNSMEEEVFKQGGTLDKYTGDGMMVVFGAPLAQADHAERAVRAALGMQQAAARVSRERGDVEWRVAYGIGITTGPAVVGHIGSRRRLDYTAIGDTVNVAARLESEAPPGAILVNQATYEAVREFAIVDKLAPTKVKGKAEPVDVYRVVRLRAGGA